jgi:hypothetical protein
MKMTVILSVLALLGATLTSAAEPIERSEIFVLDGDTIIVTPAGNEKHMKDEEYRLIGFDAPETARGKCPAEIDHGYWLGRPAILCRGRGGDDDKCQDGEGAQHVILPLWQALHEMIAKGCSLRNPDLPAAYEGEADITHTLAIGRAL